MIYKFSVHRVESEAAPGHLVRLLADLTTWKNYYLEVEDLTQASAEIPCAGPDTHRAGG